MRPKQVPKHRTSRGAYRDCPAWFQRRSEEEERRHLDATRRQALIRYLQESARQLNQREQPVRHVHVVVPDADDNLVSSSPVPDTDLDFPVSSQEFWATWRIGMDNAGVVPYISDSDDGD